jgi:hypothetical protein
VQTALDQAYEWSDKKKMTLNVNKNEATFFAPATGDVKLNGYLTIYLIRKRNFKKIKILFYSILQSNHILCPVWCTTGVNFGIVAIHYVY